MELQLSDAQIHMTGIKGSGMVALAQILQARGATVSGTDTADRFYTDRILEDLRIPVVESFAAENVDENTDIVFYSAAYDPSRHPELIRAAQLGVPMYSYSEGLGKLSETTDATGIAGVHGKSTSAALAGTITQALGLAATCVVGTMVPDFGNRAASVRGDSFLIAETCEYRRHFLSFCPDRIMITAVEADHLDYFRDYEDIWNAFCEYALRLSSGGLLVYCSDNPGATAVARFVKEKRPDVRLVGYGYSAETAFAVEHASVEHEQVRFKLSGFDEPLALRLPGKHNAVNCAGVLALVEDILKTQGRELGGDMWPRIADAIERFAGLKRRSEVVGRVDDILVLDDYAHHPTAILAEIQAIREFYPGRRLVLDFMSHTYSRTAALLGEFARALRKADVLFLHRIYASARESQRHGVTGRSLEMAVRRSGGGAGANTGLPESVVYVEEPSEALEEVLAWLRPGDIFMTMGAGDNWKLGVRVVEELRRRTSDSRINAV